MRTLLQDDNATYHCSGSDTLLGSANVAASIFILLLLGFVGGIGVTALFVWVRERRQRRLDLEYRDRNKSKAVGDIPDVEDLIKSARFVTDSDDGVHVNLSADVARDSLHFVEAVSTAPGPLQGGSQRCLHMSIEGSKALLRYRNTTLSQAEEVNPHGVAIHSRTISNVTDPESPLPNKMMPGSDGKKDNMQRLMVTQSLHDGKIQAKRIGSEIFFNQGSRLDGSASCILEEKNPNKLSSFDPPFQSAWKRISVDQNVSESGRKSSDSMRSSISGMKDSDNQDVLENPMDDAVSNNPFATTESAIKEAEDAVRQMV